MANNVESIALARERILASFQIYLQQEAFVIQPKGLGKSLIFQSAPTFSDIVRLKCAMPIVLVISPLVSHMLDQVKSISRDKCLFHWRQSKLRTGQKTCRKKVVPNCIQFTRGVSVDQFDIFGIWFR